MKKLILTLRILLFSFFALLTAQAAELPKLVAVLEVSSYKFALFESSDVTGYTWRRQGEKVGEYKVGRISTGQVVVIDASGFSTDLKTPRIYPVGEDEIVRRDWVNSENNPMLWHPIRPPRALERALQFFAEKDKRSFVQWYTTYGWRAAMVIDANGLWSIGYENIYSDFRDELMKQRIRTFRRNLSPEQLAMYNEITESLSFDKYQAKRAKLAEIRASFEASLSPELMKVYKSFSNAEGLSISALD